MTTSLTPTSTQFDGLREMRVLITARSFGRNHPPHLDYLRELGIDLVEYREEGPMDAERLRALVATVDGWVVSTAPVTPEIIAGAKRLKVVVKHGVGTDNIDLAAASKQGVMVANAPGSNHIPVAELAIGMMICLARRIHEAHASVVAGEWRRFLGSGIHGRTVGVIGVGRIGQAIAERVEVFGARVIGYDPFIDVELQRQHTSIRWMTRLSDLLAESDIISLNVPLTESTEHLINAETLSLVKPGALLINTARGKVVDERAMRNAILSGHIGGYATDVYEQEPPINSPLLGLDHVLFTPHIASYTTDAMKSLGDDVIRNLLDGLTGQTPPNLLNKPATRVVS